MSRLKSLLMYAGLLGSLFGFSVTGSFAQTAPEGTSASLLRGPEQRVALVIGNANYKNAPQLANPDNDATAMAQFLNKAGFEVTSAIDLTQNDMIRVVQDFSSKVAARGPNSVAMVYYAGHGVQLAGENYLVPVDANVSTPNDLTSNSLRLVDLMATLDSIPSRLRIVLLDACRNNPFPGVNDAGRGLAIVDAPNGSIVGYSTAPGTEALDGSGEHSPYLQAFLNRANEPNLPIEQLFKRVRLDVAGSTAGKQIPWESSSLTSDFYFFGDTAVAATRAPARGPVVAAASNLPSRSVQQAYDFVLSEGQPHYYEQFIAMYPHDPLCDRIRWLLRNLVVAQAWHKAVIANSPFAYKTFADNFGDSPYAKVALNLQNAPKVVPLMQATKLIVSPQLAPQLKQPVNFGLPKEGIKIGDVNGQNNGQKVGGLGINLPGNNGNTGTNGGKIVTLPAPGGNNGNAGNGNTGGGKIVTLPVNNGGNSNNGPANTGVNGGRIGTLPVNNGNNGNNGPANTGINGGKIGTLPVNNGGQTGSGQTTRVDVKTSMPVNRVTTLPSNQHPQLNNGPAMKLNNNPSMGTKLNQGNAQPRTMTFGANNGGSRMAMGGNQMRRGF
ncbi:caspase family protein [Bradyrhizobium sp.]|uniref:caspase family protein n=1 Tax=Bradyrhizobium sp. TaxID=376 RepID=UPI001DB8E16D|nr:caspase family protein [Bradyrhizobium sp.]MBI5320999.1 caspase family protein [Bradyrhizobium sp.]